MARTPRWTIGNVNNGVVVVTLSSWKWFADWINHEMLDYNQYIYRGHASARWKLESSLDRALKKILMGRRLSARNQHLENFKLASRGRRGSNPRRIKSDNEWWAIGQHNGLVTPLLDFTEAPFVALYFAFEEIDTDGSEYRTVWALNHEVVGMVDDAEVVIPFSDENARLVSQRGLFVKCPESSDLETAFRAALKDESKYMQFIKIRIPNTDRTICIRSLNQMNINHASLFPDLYGASESCNTKIHIKDY